MGGLSSKIGRASHIKPKFSASGPICSDLPPHPVSRARPVAREIKDHDIERDGKDPHLLANLGRIGQVDVKSNSGSKDAEAGRASHIYRTRYLAEQHATSTRPVRNRLLVGSLSNLLDDRKFVTSQNELAQLATKYTIDSAVLDSIARFVNTPGIGEGTFLRTMEDNGQEKLTMQAIWTDPIMKV